jgi:hypothetical protein
LNLRLKAVLTSLCILLLLPGYAPAPVPEVLLISAELDPSVAAADIPDPYEAMNRYAREVYKPDKELYNTVCRAADAMLSEVDVSQFHATPGQIASISDCFFIDKDYGFYNLTRVRLSPDGKKALLSYNGDTPEQAARNKEELYARLSHFLYNVAPAPYTDIQKVAAVYQYICGISTYAADVSDETTHKAYSVLMKNQGRYGFADLVDYTLNRIGVPCAYVANEMHAWNIVTIAGKRYHLDATNGTGSYGSVLDSLNTFLTIRRGSIIWTGASFSSATAAKRRRRPTHAQTATWRGITRRFTTAGR